MSQPVSDAKAAMLRGTRDLPAGVLAVGNPARVVRRLDAPTNP